MRPSDTWICVADAAHAQLFRCDGRGRCIEPLLDYALASPGRNPDHHAMTRFAGRLAVQLDRAAAERLFEHLLLVAPSGMLGALRHTLGDHARSLVCAEVDKDLTHATPRELTTHLCDSLPH